MYNFVQEFLRCSVDIFDLLGIAFVLSRIPGKGHSKLISAGLGWAAAEVILSRGLILWTGARGAEFSWIYIQKCLESNISLVRNAFIVRTELNDFLLTDTDTIDSAPYHRNVVMAIFTSRLDQVIQTSRHDFAYCHSIQRIVAGWSFAYIDNWTVVIVGLKSSSYFQYGSVKSSYLCRTGPDHRNLI